MKYTITMLVYIVLLLVLLLGLYAQLSLGSWANAVVIAFLANVIYTNMMTLKDKK